MVTAEEILGVAATRAFTLKPARGAARQRPGRAVHRRRRTRRRSGVIASVTRPFCGDCDRVRLTADGQVRNCLFAREESDLRTRAARRGRRRGDRRRWRAADGGKRPGHGIDDVTFLQPTRPMSADRRLSEARRPRRGSTSRRNPRAPRKSESDSRCSSHASQVLRRSGVWIFGLFHSSCHRASAAQPFAEQAAARRLSDGSCAADVRDGAGWSVRSISVAGDPDRWAGRERCRTTTGGAARHRAYPDGETGTPPSAWRANASAPSTGHHRAGEPPLEGTADRGGVTGQRSAAVDARRLRGSGRCRGGHGVGHRPPRRRAGTSAPPTRTSSSQPVADETTRADEAQRPDATWRRGSAAAAAMSSAAGLRRGGDPRPSRRRRGHAASLRPTGAATARTSGPRHRKGRRGPGIHLRHQPTRRVARSEPPGDPMSDRTYRVTEIVGTSPDGIDQAIRNGLERASETLRHLDWFEVDPGPRSGQGRRGRALPGRHQARLPARGRLSPARFGLPDR